MVSIGFICGFFRVHLGLHVYRVSYQDFLRVSLGFT